MAKVIFKISAEMVHQCEGCHVDARGDVKSMNRSVVEVLNPHRRFLSLKV
jgi:hypothetical protein